MLKGIRIERFDRYDDKEQIWLEVLVEDRHATPADVAASRIDFGDWLQGLTLPLRRMAKVLATGESTGQAARRFATTPSKISRVRQELKQSWESFQAEPPAANRRRSRRLFGGWMIEVAGAKAALLSIWGRAAFVAWSCRDFYCCPAVFFSARERSTCEW